MGKDSERGEYASPEGSRTWEYLSAAFCAVGMFCIGTVAGWNSPSLAELKSPNSRIHVTPEDASTLAACLSIGHVIALLFSLMVIDRIGRRNSVLVSILPMMINWGMIMIAESAMVLILARIMAGISIGLIAATCPIYMAELLSVHIRGSLAAIGTITASTGILFMFGIAPYLGIRATAGFCMGFTMIFLVCFWFVPDSPYFLVMVGRVDEAEGALRKLRGKTDVAEELELIKATVHEKGKSVVESDETEKGIIPKRESSFRQLFTIRGNLKSFFIAMVMVTLQHFAGHQMILFYCHIILTDMGSVLDVYVASLIFGIVQIFSASLTVLTIDRFGRRPLLFTSGIAASFFLAIIATYFFLMEHMKMDIKHYSMIPLGAVFALVIVLNIGVSTVPGTILAEIYATDVKVLANCITGFSGALMTIAVAKSYLLMVTSWGFGHTVPFFCFTIVTFFCTVILMPWLPETKGKTLLEIQKELNA